MNSDVSVSSDQRVQFSLVGLYEGRESSVQWADERRWTGSSEQPSSRQELFTVGERRTEKPRVLVCKITITDRQPDDGSPPPVFIEEYASTEQHRPSNFRGTFFLLGEMQLIY